MQVDFDVAVIGGGPAGSTAAGFLAQQGARVLVCERERFPRYHIGESLLSATMPILDLLGVMADIESAGFVKKPGGTFLWGRNPEPWSFFFREDPGGRPHAFHVLRSQFDNILFQHAGKCGAEIHDGWRVVDIAFNGVNRIEIESEEGVRRSVRSRWLIDASGQTAMIGRRDGLRKFNPFFKNLAVFGYFEDAVRLAGEIEGNILSCASRDGWFWFIPLHDGTTSVGAVIDAQRFGAAAKDGSVKLYRQLIEGSPEMSERLNLQKLVSPVRVIRDYSYCSDRFYGDGYLLAGDAACFIDPVFSTGVHLACLSGYLASRALGTVLAGGHSSEALASYDRRYRTAFERYLQFLYFFYDHHQDPESYFWQARKMLHPDSGLQAKEGFVRLMSGGADWQGDAEIAAALEQRHQKMEAATARNRIAAIPGADIFRVSRTRAELEED
ncbi:MAG TPA: NAD(P)/FAD-dependent oxidoreductase [Terriglobales bacterium]|nr:NAD(P)/FAD-dependent oxidoreductase [Terriglobales bacterium]